MAIAIVPLGIGAASGVVDQYLEARDDENKREGFGRYSTLFAVGAVAGSVALGEFMPRYSKFTDPIGIAASALAGKHLAKEFGGDTFKASISSRGRVARVPAGGLKHFPLPDRDAEVVSGGYRPS